MTSHHHIFQLITIIVITNQFIMNRCLILTCFITLCVLGINAQEDELLSIAVVFRHGDRTPTSTYPKDPYNDILFKDDDPGQLTNAGKNRQYELGKWLRHRYDDFLTSKYDHNNVSVLSDNSDRCLMSAASNLAGLYPPQGEHIWNENLLWQPIPIRINTHLLTGEPIECPSFDIHMASLLLSDWALKVNFENEKLYQYVSNNTGEIILSFLQIGTVRDTLYIESTLNLTLPSWTDGIFPGVLDDIASLMFAISTNTTTLTKFTVGPILYDIVEQFTTSNKKLHMYSGHDSNVGPIMFTLRPSQKPFCPNFASTVIFELWNKDGKKLIKVFFKNDDEAEPVEIEGCGIECPLEDFQELYKEILVSPLQWEADCLGL